MKTITTDTTVGGSVRAVSARACLFENLGMDYYCGGKKPLAEVCRAKHLDPATVIAMLAALAGAPETTSIGLDVMGFFNLRNHIDFDPKEAAQPSRPPDQTQRHED